jgi:hypothetical protein
MNQDTTIIDIQQYHDIIKSLIFLDFKCVEKIDNSETWVSKNYTATFKRQDNKIIYSLKNTLLGKIEKKEI